ncbi:MAG: hypothetical protein EZS28_033241, partial [Streblomastix strix]
KHVIFDPDEVEEVEIATRIKRQSRIEITAADCIRASLKRMT